jgi:hypothetical protein
MQSEFVSVLCLRTLIFISNFCKGEIMAFVIHSLAWGLCNNPVFMTLSFDLVACLLRFLSLPALFHCNYTPESCQHSSEASNISSHDSRLIRKVAAQSSSYCHCDTSPYGQDHCQRGNIVQWPAVGQGCFTLRVKTAEAWKWSLTSIPLRCMPCWVFFGEGQVNFVMWVCLWE